MPLAPFLAPPRTVGATAVALFSCSNSKAARCSFPHQLCKLFSIDTLILRCQNPSAQVFFPRPLPKACLGTTLIHVEPFSRLVAENRRDTRCAPHAHENDTGFVILFARGSSALHGYCPCSSLGLNDRHHSGRRAQPLRRNSRRIIRGICRRE